MAMLTATRVYLSLDALFDLRLGTLVTISPDFAFDVSKEKSYFTRTADAFSTEEFGELAPAVYDGVFNAYKPIVLKNSLITKILPLVASILVDVLKQADRINLAGPLELDVNLYPFEFSNEEANELLTLIVHKLGKIASINLINLKPEDMTVEYVKNNYLAVVMYRYHEWFNMHHKDLMGKGLKNTGFYLPRINFISEFTEEQKKLFKKHGADVFDLMAKALAHFVTIRYASVSLYSAELPHNDAEMKK